LTAYLAIYKVVLDLLHLEAVRVGQIPAAFFQIARSTPIIRLSKTYRDVLKEEKKRKKNCKLVIELSKGIVGMI